MADRIEAEPGPVGAFITFGTISHDRLELHLDPGAIAGELSVPEVGLAPGLLNLSNPFTLRQRGIETKIIARATVPAPDPVLQRTVAEAHRGRET